MTSQRVLFVCLHGAAKSVLAAADSTAWRRSAVCAHRRVGRHEPDPEIAPGVAAALEAEGVNMTGCKPQLVSREMAAAAARIVAFGCDLGAAAPPGATIEQWTDVPRGERRIAGRTRCHPTPPRAPARWMERVMKWITEKKPVSTGSPAPGSICRFIDKEPEFLFVPDADVMATAKREGATPYDVPGVELGHHGERCSFRRVPRQVPARDPALQALALIVRGADTDRRAASQGSLGSLRRRERLP